MVRSLDNKTLRPIYYFLIVLAVLLIVWRVYQWSQGRDNFYGIGSPLGLVFLFAAMIVGKSNIALYYGLLAAALLCVFASFIPAFIG